MAQRRFTTADVAVAVLTNLMADGYVGHGEKIGEDGLRGWLENIHDAVLECVTGRTVRQPSDAAVPVPGPAALPEPKPEAGSRRRKRTEAQAAALRAALRPPVLPTGIRNRVWDTVRDGAIVCLEDGQAYRNLTRVLWHRWGLTPTLYRERWGLPADYPVNAPELTDTKRRNALASGLGKNKRRREPARGNVAEGGARVVYLNRRG